jgi:hypothetical protein
MDSSFSLSMASFDFVFHTKKNTTLGTEGVKWMRWMGKAVGVGLLVLVEGRGEEGREERERNKERKRERERKKERQRKRKRKKKKKKTSSALLLTGFLLSQFPL